MADGPPVDSGPGALSRRTDRGPAQKIATLPDAAYGEQATFRAAQNAGPLSQTPAIPTGAVSRGGPPLAGPGSGLPLTPLDAPSANPGQPVTHGADSGPGPGTASLGLPNQQQSQWQSARDFIQSLASQQPDNSALAYLAEKVRGGL